MCLDYTKEFMIIPFAYKHTIVAMLLQKNYEGHEQPIAFAFVNKVLVYEKLE